tara:strand:- start:2525 stop:5416 length:2892 start_codon:yes stop_codon:yes gene_type:complete
LSESAFFSGQRWVSNTESELGLGIVIECIDRLVTLSFPASGERRVYAIENAPLSRVTYEIGETIRIADGGLLRVTERQEANGCLIYGGISEDGSLEVLPEFELDSFVQFSRPLDRLFAGQIDKNNAFLLRAESLRLQHLHRQSQAYGLVGPRVQLLPHQFYIAKEVAGRHQPRVLLADEVGLGKTIEAGLILHQLVMRGEVDRVLIVVPDNLVHQWLAEMLRRFNLHFTILDEEICAAIEGSDNKSDEYPEDCSVNPFESSQLILVGLSSLVNYSERQAQAIEAHWDLLIVDEAHHLAWNQKEVSPGYGVIEALSKKALGLVLITATPEQLGIEGHFARLRLLDPHRYHDLREFLAEEKNYQPIADLVVRLLDPASVESILGDCVLQNLLVDFLGQNKLEEIIAADLSQRPVLITQAINDLLDRYGTGRVLYRNCRDTVQGFPERKFYPYPLVAPAEYLSQSANASSSDLLLPENLLGESWFLIDPRVEWLGNWLHEHRGQKTLVICAQATTAIALEEHLRTRGGIRSAVFHEGLDLIARDRAAAYFADEQESAEALVCSEIGSEGRNFQSACNLVLFDIPLNPDLLEQRIGRLDRIGQRHIIQIHVPYYAASAPEALIKWYDEGINAFEQVFSGGHLLLEHFEGALKAVIRGPYDENALDALIQATRTKAAETREALRLGRDRLLEINSHDAAEASEIVDAVTAAGRKLELANYMDGMFDFFGVEQERQGSLSVVVRPGDHMLCHSFPGLPEGGVTGTYDRSEALSKEDMHFLTWEHPMVSGAMEMMLSGEFGNATLCALKAPFLKPGALYLEAIFVVSCTAPRYLQLPRYISQGTIRVVVDGELKDLGGVLTQDRINAVVEPIKKHVAHEVAKKARPEINAMANRATQIAETQFDPILNIARNDIDVDQRHELDRLQTLAAVNPNIRQEEISYRKQFAAELLAHVNHIQLRMDAARVGLAI